MTPRSFTMSLIATMSRKFIKHKMKRDYKRHRKRPKALSSHCKIVWHWRLYCQWYIIKGKAHVYTSVKYTSFLYTVKILLFLIVAANFIISFGFRWNLFSSVKQYTGIKPHGRNGNSRSRSSIGILGNLDPDCHSRRDN